MYFTADLLIPEHFWWTYFLHTPAQRTKSLTQTVTTDSRQTKHGFILPGPDVVVLGRIGGCAVGATMSERAVTAVYVRTKRR